MVAVGSSVCSVGGKLRVGWPACGSVSFGFRGSAVGVVGGVCQTSVGVCRAGDNGIVMVRTERGGLVSGSCMVGAVSD